MKRNKKTQVLAHEELTPLTEHILTNMGKEGSAIRERLKMFYRERAVNQIGLDPPREVSILEAGSG